MRRWISFFLVLALICGMISIPEKVYANPYGGGNGNCTYTAWQLAYENTGVSLPGWGNAGTWYDSARNAGYMVSTVPRAQSIAVWSGGSGGMGHVAYVAQVSGDQIYIQEGGYSGGYHEGWENAYGQTKNYSWNYLTMIGYIYLGGTALTKVNLGESFYAFITNAYCNLEATAIDGDIKLKKTTGTGNQVFQFTRQDDGYYQILECASKKSMDVFNGSSEMRANVGTYIPNGTTAQKWYITGNGPYTIRAACTDCVLSAAWGATSDGASINMETDGQGDWQKWYIRKMPSVGRTTVNVYVERGETTFNWLQATDCNSYSLRILKNGKDFHSEYGLKVLSKTVKLEPGTYTAYIDSCNAYSYIKSNEVTFTVTESTGGTEVAPCNHSNTQTHGAREKTCVADGYTGDVICVDCHEVIEQGTVLSAEGHVWGDFIMVWEADCVNDGEYRRTCKNCDETETKAVAALGHTAVEDEAVPATTSSDGLTRGSHCSVCGEVLEEQRVVPKLTTPQPSQDSKEPVNQQPPQNSTTSQDLQNSTPSYNQQNVLNSQKQGQVQSDTQKIVEGQIYLSGKLYYKVLSKTDAAVAVEKPLKRTEKTIKIPDAVSINGVICIVTEISKNAFKNNKKLRKVTIGKNVTVVGKKAFAGCKRLKKIKIKSEKLKKAYASSIKGIAKTAVIDVPNKNIDAYKKLFGVKKRTKFV